MGTARKAPIPFPLPEDLTGSKIGRFVIVSKLGAGGMGEVYRAEDTKLKRSVALKRVTRRLGNDQDARQRILGEAQRASVLTSEHIAGIHDVLEEDGELFLVMEYVEGETLRRRLQRPMALEEFFDIATQCAEALIAAHEHAIVHCDIKPENIMLTPEGQVKILDFGLAKHLPRSDQSSTLERTRPLGGTPGYMAPEVLLEKLPDEGADIFSLGVVLYEMLTRTHPFLANSFAGTIERILHETPTAVRILNPNVPEVLNVMVLKAMAKTPAQRYVTARELLKDLRLLQAGGLPSNLTPAAPLPEERKDKRRLAAVGVLITVVAAISAIYWWTHRPPLLAERGWVLISDFETSGDRAIPDKAVREGLTICAYEVLQRMKKGSASRIDETLGREICQRENLQVLLAGSMERMGQVFQITVRGLDPAQGGLLFAERVRFDREDQFFEQADGLAKQIRKDLGESLERIEKSSRPLAKVTTTSLGALQLYSQAQDASDQGSEQVPLLLKGALELDPDFAMAHLRLGQYFSAAVGKNERAVAELERAYLLRQGVTEREQHKIEAGYYGLQEQYEDEVQSLSILVARYPDDEEAQRELASAYRDIGQFEKAILGLHEVLRLNPTSAPAYQSLVLYLARSNQPEAAIAAYREAQRRGVETSWMHWGLGLAYLGLNDASTARQEFQRMSRGTETDRELQDLNLVTADLYEGKLDSARAALVKQIQAVPQRSGGLQTIRRYSLGRIYLSRGSSREAIAEADLIQQVPSSGVQTFDLLNAGILYARAGNLGQARQILRRLDHSRKSVPSSWNQSCFHNLEGEIWMLLPSPKRQRSPSGRRRKNTRRFSLTLAWPALTRHRNGGILPLTNGNRFSAERGKFFKMGSHQILRMHISNWHAYIAK
jgi:tetratricopeptide (TPR) repeat protein